MRRMALALAGAFLAAAVAFGVVAVRLRSRPPLASLPREGATGAALVREWSEADRGRTLLHVTLEGAAVGRARFVVSLPDPLPERPMPIAIVLGGLRGGSNSVRELGDVAGDPGPNAFVGYDWPLPEREPAVLDVALRLVDFRRDILLVPGQVDTIVAWASKQAWADRERVSLLGFSLGAFVVPAAQRLAQDRGANIRWTILAYGGAPIGAVISGHPKAGPAWLRPVFGALSDLLLRPVEPSFHLPHLRGRFFVLSARTDRLIARRAADRLAALTPEPRTVILIEGDHMGVGPEKLDLLERVVELSRAWLLEQGAIDPPPAIPARSGSSVPPPARETRRARSGHAGG